MRRRRKRRSNPSLGSVVAALVGTAVGGAAGYYIHLHRALSAADAQLPADQAAGAAMKRAAIYSALGAGVGGVAAAAVTT